MARQQKYANRTERNVANGRTFRDREAREREAGLALVRRSRPRPAVPDPKTLDAIALYRTEKARAMERGVDLTQSSGRHPRINDCANSSRGLMRVAL